MAIVTSQQLKEYYHKYESIDVTFTKEINQSLGLVKDQIIFKYKGGQRPCIIYAASLTGARVVVAISDEMMRIVRRENLVSLRFSFHRENKVEPLSFQVQSRITGLTQYDAEKQLYFAQLTYTQHPPDDLIEILGGLLEANINAARRAEERIIITADSIRKLSLESKSAILVIDGVPRNSILRDVSFGGAKVIVMGNPKFLMGKEVTLKITPVTGKAIAIRGKVVRFEPVEGRRELAAIAMQYVKDAVPFEYKMIINEYLKHKPKYIPPAAEDE